MIFLLISYNNIYFNFFMIRFIINLIIKKLVGRFILRAKFFLTSQFFIGILKPIIGNPIALNNSNILNVKNKLVYAE
jgi:hypothetical protein